MTASGLARQEPTLAGHILVVGAGAWATSARLVQLMPYSNPCRPQRFVSKRCLGFACPGQEGGRVSPPSKGAHGPVAQSKEREVRRHHQLLTGVRKGPVGAGVPAPRTPHPAPAAPPQRACGHALRGSGPTRSLRPGGWRAVASVHSCGPCGPAAWLWQGVGKLPPGHELQQVTLSCERLVVTLEKPVPRGFRGRGPSSSSAEGVSHIGPLPVPALTGLPCPGSSGVGEGGCLLRGRVNGGGGRIHVTLCGPHERRGPPPRVGSTGAGLTKRDHRCCPRGGGPAASDKVLPRSEGVWRGACTGSQS